MLGVLAFLVWVQAHQSRSLTLVSDGYWPLANLVATLETDRQRVDTDVERVLADRPRPGSPSFYSDRLRATLSAGHAQVARSRELATSASDLASLNLIDAQLTVVDRLFQEYDALSTQVIAHAVERAVPDLGAGVDAPPLEERRQALAQAGTRLGAEIDKLEIQVKGRVSEQIDETRASQARATAVAAALFVLTTLFVSALIIAVLAALAPIARLTEQVQRLAGGDYTGRVEVRGRDEIAVLGGEFNTMVAAIRARDEALRVRAADLDRVSGYLGSVLDSLEDALLVVEHGRVTLTNPAAQRSFSAEDRPPEVLGAAVDAPGRYEVEVGERRFEVRSQRLGATGMVVVAADVTEQSRTRARLARSERLALVGQMLAQVTHEIRNPLNALSLNAEMLAEELGVLDPDRRTEAPALLGVVTREIDRLTALTGHYLQLARRPRATLVLDDPVAILEDVTRLLGAELKERNVVVSCDFAAVGLVPVDGNQLRQAVLNLMRNAVESGATRLVLRLSNDVDDVVLSLVDDGPGFAPDALQHAFDPFFSTKAAGTGLGLAITKQILEDHDGTVAIRSGAAIGGTEVTLRWPRRPRPVASVEDVSSEGL